MAEPAVTGGGDAGTRWTAEHSAALVRAPLLTCNFHELRPEDATVAEDRLRRLRDVGAPFDPEDPAPDGPRILVGFYDSYRYASRFGADLCARLDIRAYFFPTFDPGDEPGSAALSDRELSDIASAHEIGFHTWGHVRADQVTAATVDHEVDATVQRITAVAGSPPRVAAWRGGSRFDADRVGNRRILQLGCRFLVSNWSVEAIGPTS